MSCGPCNCSDCRIDRLEEDEKPPPIRRMTWDEAAPANETQAKAWMGYINEVYAQYPTNTIPMQAMLSMVCQKIPGLKAENYLGVMASVERFIRESPSLELRKGKNGGVFRKTLYMDLHPMTGVPDMITGKLTDNYTCGCGNTKLNRTEKSCWKCGAAIT